MSDPKDQQPEPDELELESETVKDLDVEEKGAEQIRAGHSTISTLGN